MITISREYYDNTMILFWGLLMTITPIIFLLEKIEVFSGHFSQYIATFLVSGIFVMLLLRAPEFYKKAKNLIRSFS